MRKLKSIEFVNHKVLGNLKLDFAGLDGNAVDTVIIAGDNGTGKSTILDALYKLASRRMDFASNVVFQIDGEKEERLEYSYRHNNNLYARLPNGSELFVLGEDYKRLYSTSGIFSDVDINFNSSEIAAVTSMNLDEKRDSRKSSKDLPREINQLLVDIQALDDGELSKLYREALKEGKDTNSIKPIQRIPRFTRAFEKIFTDLEYDHIENDKGHKVIYFKKNGCLLPIEQLSSGEKQIVYRGCFLLKDVNAISGAFVFIDEPEISMHPMWQKRILDYYKAIFTNDEGIQTSQIFIVTHSPFIIHNENRANDKVLVLKRDGNDVTVLEKPEYFKCDSIEAVQDAFSITNFTDDKSYVYVEGRTDELYFKKACEVFGYDNLPFEFSWIGYMNDKCNEFNTGDTALNNAIQYLTGRKLRNKVACLYDCDVDDKKIPALRNDKIIVCKMREYVNSKGMNKGVENLLVLDQVDMTPFYREKIITGDYNTRKIITEFEKMKFCEYICSTVDNELSKQVLVNLKSEIDRLIGLFNG